MNKDYVKKTVVTIPKGFFCARYMCGDCIYLNLNDSNKYGEYYCGRKGRDYPPDDTTCNDFVEKR